jgi:hypothetical protein
MVIETICEAPQELLMGAAALVGASLYAGYSIWQHKRNEKNFKFSWPIFLDTVWQSTLTGAAAGLALGCSWGSIVIAMMSGVGMDRITNKVKWNDKQIFNFVQLITGLGKKKK